MFLFKIYKIIGNCRKDEKEITPGIGCRILNIKCMHRKLAKAFSYNLAINIQAFIFNAELSFLHMIYFTKIILYSENLSLGQRFYQH